MPRDFEKCVKNGGKVRRVSGPSKKHGLGSDEYVNYCTDKNGTHRGEVKKKKSSKNSDSQNNALLQGGQMELKEKMQIPRSGLCIEDSAEVRLSGGGEGEKKKASLLAYSGKIIKGHWLWGNLAIDVSGIEFKRKRNPILEQHDIYRKIGFSNKLPNLDNKIEFEEVQLLDNEVANEFYQNSKDGFPYQASIGIRPTVLEEVSEGETVEVNGQNMKGPGVVFRKSIYRETSVCVFGYDQNTNSQALSDDDSVIELSVDIVKQDKDNGNNTPVKDQNKGTKNSEGVIMNLKELKEGYPQLVQELTDEIKGAFSEEIDKKDNQIKELQSKNTELSDQNTNLGQRVSNLEKESTLRTEKDLKSQVSEHVTSKLSDSNVPTRLHQRVQSQFSYNNYVKEDNSIDFEKLSKEVDAEIKEWETALSEKDTSVRGAGGSTNTFADNKNGDEFSEDKAADITSRILGHIGVSTDTQQ